MQFQHEPRQQDFDTPTGYLLAKDNWDKACQSKIIEAATSDGKVTEGFFRKPRARKQPKPGRPPFPHREDFESEEAFKEAFKVYHAKSSNIRYYERKKKLGIVDKRVRTGITLPCPSRKDYADEDSYRAAMKDYKREYNKQYMAKIKPKLTAIQENNEAKPAYNSPSMAAVEMAKAYLADKIDSEKLQGLIDSFIISLALQEAMKKIENI